MKNREYKIKFDDFASEPEKAKDSPNYIFRLKLSEMPDPLWEEKFREVCEQGDYSTQIPASVCLDIVTVECRMADFEGKYFKLLKEAAKSASEDATAESKRANAEQEYKVAQKKRQEEEDQKRLVGLTKRLKFD
jgi:hypothetical protein